MKTPQDYTNGVQEMIEDGLSDPYPELTPLAMRKTTDITLKSGTGDDEAGMALKYGFSQPITQHSRLTQKLYGYGRDANLQGHLEQSAVRGAHALNDLIFDAPCLNRQGRYDEEEKQAKDWQSKMDAANPKPDPEPDIDGLLNRWSEADAFMLQARIVEEQYGIDHAEVHYEEYSSHGQAAAGGPDGGR